MQYPWLLWNLIDFALWMLHILLISLVIVFIYTSIQINIEENYHIIFYIKMCICDNPIRYHHSAHNDNSKHHLQEVPAQGFLCDCNGPVRFCLLHLHLRCPHGVRHSALLHQQQTDQKGKSQQHTGTWHSLLCLFLFNVSFSFETKKVEVSRLIAADRSFHKLLV